MAKFPKLKLTKGALQILQKAVNDDGNLQIKIKEIRLGDGKITNDTEIENLTSLVNEKQVANITEQFVDAFNKSIKLKAVNTNKYLNEGYYFREIGVFGTYDNTTDFLIAYANAGEECDYIPDKSTPIDSQIFNIQFAIGNTDNLKIEIKDDTFVTVGQLNQHINDLNAHKGIFTKLKEWVVEVFATKSEVKENKEYSEKVYLKKRELPKIDFSPYLKKSDAENTYQPKGNYVKDLNFKDKLLSIAGVKYSIEDNGYICFGPLFGGLIIQWGVSSNIPSYEGAVMHKNFNISYQLKCFLVGVFEDYAVTSTASPYNDWNLSARDLTKTDFRVDLGGLNSGNRESNAKFYWISLGK